MTETTYRVPGRDDVEVQLRSLLGKDGRWAVRTLEIRPGRPVKDDWRQIGSEVVYDSEEQARAAANALWARLRDAAKADAK